MGSLHVEDYSNKQSCKATDYTVLKANASNLASLYWVERNLPDTWQTTLLLLISLYFRVKMKVQAGNHCPVGSSGLVLILVLYAILKWLTTSRVISKLRPVFLCMFRPTYHQKTQTYKEQKIIRLLNVTFLHLPFNTLWYKANVRWARWWDFDVFADCAELCCVWSV